MFTLLLSVCCSIRSFRSFCFLETHSVRVSGMSVQVSFFVICLKNDPMRMARVRSMAEILPNLTIIDAVDGAALTCAEIHAMAESGRIQPDPRTGRHTDLYIDKPRDMTVGNLGSFLSHRAAVSAVANMPPGSYGVVLEDDVVCFQNFVPTVHAIAQALSDAAREGVDFQIDFLNMFVWEQQRDWMNTHTQMYLTKEHSKMDDGPRFVASPEGMWGMQCYMMPADRASKVVEGLSQVKGATDEQITRIGLNSVALLSPIILSEDPAIPSHTARIVRTLDDMLKLHA